MYITRLFQTLFLTLALFTTVTASPLLPLASPTRYTSVIYPVDSSKPALLKQGMPETALFPPASTQKLLTATAALLELGANFTFTTTLSRSGKDIVIQFTGDPTLTTRDLRDLLLAMKQGGIHTISGDIWLDNSVFNSYESAVGWPWDILGVCYSAPSSAITLDENCIPGSIYTNQDGSTRVYIPEQYPVAVTSHVNSVTQEEQKQLLCSLELISSLSNRYELNGCLTFRAKPLPLKFAIRNTQLYTQNQVTTLLKQLGIRLTGNIKVGSPPANQQQIIAQKRSPLLSDLIKVMLRDSDNLIANNLAKMIGHHYYQQPGNFANGMAAIKALLSTQGIDLTSAQLYDGSGLSRSNRLSARQLVDLLAYIARNDQQLHLIEALAKAGESGTLRYRRSMREAPVKGAIIGKSGSLYATYNMAGFGLDKSGNVKTIFVQLVTDYFPDKESKRSELQQFEKHFYQYIVEQSQR